MESLEKYSFSQVRCRHAHYVRAKLLHLFKFSLRVENFSSACINRLLHFLCISVLNQMKSALQEIESYSLYSPPSFTDLVAFLGEKAT